MDADSAAEIPVKLVSVCEVGTDDIFTVLLLLPTIAEGEPAASDQISAVKVPLGEPMRSNQADAAQQVNPPVVPNALAI